MQSLTTCHTDVTMELSSSSASSPAAEVSLTMDMSADVDLAARLIRSAITTGLTTADEAYTMGQAIVATADAVPVTDSLHRVLIACELGPAGASFEPAAMISLRYVPREDVDGATLFLACWDGAAWVALGGSVDTLNHIVTALTGRTGLFAVIGAVIQPAASVTPTPTLTPTQTVTFTVTPTASPTASVTATSDVEAVVTPDGSGGFNWPLAVGTLAGLLVLGLAALYFKRRRD